VHRLVQLNDALVVSLGSLKIRDPRLHCSLVSQCLIRQCLSGSMPCFNLLSLCYYHIFWEIKVLALHLLAYIGYMYYSHMCLVSESQTFTQNSFRFLVGPTVSLFKYHVSWRSQYSTKISLQRGTVNTDQRQTTRRYLVYCRPTVFKIVIATVRSI